MSDALELNPGPTAPARRLSALVVCGGRSSRLGADKARVRLGNATLLERALATVRALTDEVRLASGSTARYSDTGVPASLDRFADAGPLAGIEAGLADLPAGHAIVLAVDLPRVDPGLLEALCARALEQDLDVALLGSPTGLEPLCACWSTRMRGPARRALESGRRRVTSAFDERRDDGQLPRIAVFEIGDLRPASEGALTNVNTRADLALAEARATRPAEVA